MFVVNTSVGLFALLLDSILSLTAYISRLLLSSSQIESRMVSLERCLKFTDIKAEPGYKGLEKLEKDIRANKAVIDGFDKEPNWPGEGVIEVKELFIRYREDLEDVIKGLTVTLEAGTKVGLVGRTGAGKSTFISSIYGSFSDYKGEILVDGKEIREIDLKALRNNVSVIPQDPYLFEDSIRNNIDPLKAASDQEVAEILKEVGLWDKFAADGGLDFPI